MHSFFIFGAVLHATVLAVVSFFVFFAASRAEGRLATFGNTLGIWLLVLAVIALVGIIVMIATGNTSGGYGYHMMGGSGYGWMHGSGQPGYMHNWMNGAGQPPATTP